MLLLIESGPFVLKCGHGQAVWICDGDYVDAAAGLFVLCFLSGSRAALRAHRQAGTHMHITD